MSSDVVTTNDLGGVRVITVNRPDKLNALNAAVFDGLEAAVAGVADDPAIGAAIITGAGEKAFVAGADIGQFVGADTAAGEAASRRGQQVFAAIEQSGTVFIAAINGFALGGGCELALSCHLRVAATTARFGQPEVKLGLIPGWGGTQRLTRLIGRGRALELLLGGGMIDAATALAWGLVNRVVEPTEVLATALKMAEGILQVSPAAVATAIAAVNVGADLSLDRALQLEARLFGACFGTPDMVEGVDAFLAKRPPHFTR